MSSTSSVAKGVGGRAPEWRTSAPTKTYGTLGALISLLVWLWITNLALLLGIEFDAELERSRELSAGLPAEEEIQLEPREPAKETDAKDPGWGEGEALERPPEFHSSGERTTDA